MISISDMGFRFVSSTRQLHVRPGSRIFMLEASAIWEDLSYCDLLVGGGDMNARIRNDDDYLLDVDEQVPPRCNPDETKNTHGGTFLTYNRAVVLNKRVTPKLNKFTFISIKGRCVPDHIFCPITHLP